MTDAIRPTLLMYGQGEAMDAALKVALDRHGLAVEDGVGDVRASVRMVAPDLVLLVGDAAADGGRAVLDALAIDPVTNVVPVIVLGAQEKLDSRVTAFRAGAVAVVAKTASADQIATRIAQVARELGERGEARPDELGEATFDELVNMVASELRSGILSVGRTKQGAGEPMRIVLGAGRPVADAVEEFVRKLRPLVSRAEPLQYELHAGAGGPVGLLEPEPAGRGDLSILQGLRVILIDSDASRADTLATELRQRGAVVAVADPSSRGIERARGLDPQVVIVDQAGIDGAGFEVVRAIRRDVRLRWAAMLVAPWADIWPEHAATPDLAELATHLAPLVVHDRELRERAGREARFDERLEVIGPARMLRVLASLAGPFHVSVQSRKAQVEIDVAEGLVVGARATRAAGDVLEGTRALAALLVMASARVTVERRPNPATANVMAPVDEALARASQEAAPIPISTPPPPTDSALALARGLKKGALPTASEVGRARFDESDASGPHRAADVRTRATAPKGDTTSRDLRWGESEVGEERPSQVGHVPQGVFSTAKETPPVGAARPGIPQPAGRVRPPRSAFAAESKPFFPAAPGSALPKKEDATRPVNEVIAKANEAAPDAQKPDAQKQSGGAKDSAPGTLQGQRREPPPSRPPAPRKATLVMGAGSAPPSRPPIGAGQPVAPPRHATTIAMGSVEPSAAEPPPTTNKGPRPPRPGTIVGLPVPPKDLEARDLETVSASVETDATSVESEPAIHAGMSAAPEPDRKTEPLDLDAPPPLPPAAARPRVRTPLFGEPREAAPDAPPLPKQPAHDAPARAHADAPKMPPPPGELSPPPRHEDAAPPSDASEAELPIGALAATPSLAPPPVIGGPRPDPTPLGVVVPPSPPSGVATSRPPPPAASAAAPAGRGVAWALVGLGALACVGVSGWIAYARQDELRVALGMDAPPPSVISLADAAVDTAADAAPPAADAGAAALVAEADAFVEGIDAGAEDAGEEVDAFAGDDAWTAPPEEVDAAVAPPGAPHGADVVAEVPTEVPTGDLTADQLVEQAAELPDPQAETLYRRALNLDARNHYAAIGLAEILMRRGAAAEAIPYIETAIRRRGRRAEYRVMLGDARRDSGDAAGAQRAWREALEIDPDDRDAHQRLGE